MTTTLKGPRKWGCTRDQEGHREYKITHLVISDSTEDGPFVVLQTTGLPEVGSPWAFDNDFDPWATCKANATAKQMIENEPGIWWEVEQTFSTKGDKTEAGKCSDQQIEDPLLKPPVISGGSTKITKEATKNKDGTPIVNSAFEQIRGPQVEFDDSRDTVRVEMNVARLQQELWTPMKNRVNSSTLWGFPARTVKLSNVTWERKFYGTCSIYYTITYEFEIDVHKAVGPVIGIGPAPGAAGESEVLLGWDRRVLDEGTKALNGKYDATTKVWTLININGAPPNRDNPTHFIKFTDLNGNPARVVLDGLGEPITDEIPAGTVGIQYYLEADFLLLGIPSIY